MGKHASAQLAVPPQQVSYHILHNKCMCYSRKLRKCKENAQGEESSRGESPKCGCLFPRLSQALIILGKWKYLI